MCVLSTVSDLTEGLCVILHMDGTAAATSLIIEISRHADRIGQDQLVNNVLCFSKHETGKFLLTGSKV